MCIGFIKKLFGMDSASEEHQTVAIGGEMHEYQKTSNPAQKDDVITDESSSDEETDFDEEGIFQQDKKNYLSGNDIQDIEDDDQEEGNQVQYLKEDKLATQSITSAKTDTSVKIEFKAKEKPGVKEDAFKQKAHDKFQSKGKKMLDKRKLKVKKVEKTKTEVK